MNPLTEKTLKTSEIPEVEEALFIWFKQQRNRNAPISGDILKQNLIFYHEITKKTDFRASHGWFQNFKKRHGVRYMQMSGEKVSANESEIQEFIGKLDAKIIELGLDPEQIYNADETGMNWRQLSTKTFVTEEEKKFLEENYKKNEYL
ncbi:Tc5 transposase DNA-binding domain [Popillia japonica]|uniref:Tc5 transposase DNA-binding domain n=1 Tax=Popillia japonica TaxID=7064 RepID=A0AAW1MGQ0_POPJA